MRPAVVVVDMLVDNLTPAHGFPITDQALAIAAPINRLTAWARDRSYPVIFACDSFLEDDFLFKGKMGPHSIRGTPGAEVTEHLDRLPQDTILPKRRFSAFFKTDLDQTLRTWKVDTVIACGIATQFCVLATALDALSHDFTCLIASDACAAHKPAVHEQALSLFKKTPLYPLLQVATIEEIRAQVDKAGGGE